MLEQTLAIIKPDAIHRADEIFDDITERGFVIIRKRRVQLTPEQASDFYSEHFGKEFFRKLVLYMSSGPIYAMILAKTDAISAWRDVIGPTNTQAAKALNHLVLRAKYGTDSTHNALHGSDSIVSAMREIKFFFPEVSVASPVEAANARDYLNEKVNPTLIRGLTALCKNKPADPLRWLATWMEENNPNKPQVEEPED